MSAFGPAVLAALVAFIVASVELITTKYPRTFGFIRNSWCLYAYAALYAIIAFGVQIGWNALKGSASVSPNGFVLSNPWVLAIIIGISVKAFMHIRLFTVTSGANSFPVGVESLVQLFEPWLLDTLRLHYLLGINTFIGRHSAHFTDLAGVKKTVVDRSGQILSGDAQAGFSTSVNQAQTVDKAMELYLNLVGKQYFEQTFQIPN
jgi:hypothetical protein